MLTTALSITAWDAACQAVYNQPMLIKNEAGLYGTGPKMAINPKFCLVPRALQNTAWQMLKGEFVREENYTYDNILKGSAVPITVPEWTDADDWAAVCDPQSLPQSLSVNALASCPKSTPQAMNFLQPCL